MSTDLIFTRKGRCRNGTRVHLVSDLGGTLCLCHGRLTEVTDLDVGEPVDPGEWCRSCLQQNMKCVDLELADLEAKLAAERWDAAMEMSIGAFILDYLDENPAPDGSRLVERFARCGRELEHEGKERLLDLGGGDA